MSAFGEQPEAETLDHGRTVSSKVVVVVIVTIALALALFARWYLTSGGDHRELAAIDCDRMSPTIAEVQRQRLTLDQQTVCTALKDLARATPTADGFDVDANDPWHYIGRVRLQPEGETWFLVFVARRSTGFRAELSLRRHRGAGWAVVGQFDGEPVLARLGLSSKIDRAKLELPEALEARDHRQPL